MNECVWTILTSAVEVAIINVLSDMNWADSIISYGFVIESSRGGILLLERSFTISDPFFSSSY